MTWAEPRAASVLVGVSSSRRNYRNSSRRGTAMGFVLAMWDEHKTKRDQNWTLRLWRRKFGAKVKPLFLQKGGRV